MKSNKKYRKALTLYSLDMGKPLKSKMLAELIEEKMMKNERVV
jgi:hypothetical protein